MTIVKDDLSDALPDTNGVAPAISLPPPPPPPPTSTTTLRVSVDAAVKMEEGMFRDYIQYTIVTGEKSRVGTHTLTLANPTLANRSPRRAHRGRPGGLRLRAGHQDFQGWPEVPRLRWAIYAARWARWAGRRRGPFF